MSSVTLRQGLEKISDVGPVPPASRPRRQARGVWLNVRGRSIKLYGLRRDPKGLGKWLLILGPGLIATSAGNDAGGIASYTAAGAAYGYKLIWVMVLLTPALALVQEMVSRIGAATGRGLLDLIRERFGLGWSLLALTTLLVANSSLVVSEFVGIGSAGELLGVSPWVAIPLAAVGLAYVVIYGSYRRVEKVFLLMSLVFLAYPLAAILARPDWGQVARGAFVPTIEADPAFLFLFVALIGTTITPYMQLFQQSSMVDKGVGRRRYGPERVDAYVGAGFSNLMSISMMVAAGATLHLAGKTDLETAAEAAGALQPVVGNLSQVIFGVGLMGACLLAAAVLPLATAYAVTEAFGFPKGISLDSRRGKVFYQLFTILLVGGAACALIPNIPVIRMLTVVQVLNGALLPIILFFILRLAGDERLMGELKNNRAENALGWVSLAGITIAVTLMLLDQAVGIF